MNKRMLAHNKVLGWRPDLPDFRDIPYKNVFSSKDPKMKTQHVDLRDKLPPCWDQLQSSSCTVHGISACLVYNERNQNKNNVMPSRLFIYYNERDEEGTVNEDSGAIIRDGIKTVVRNGFAPENLWPFNLSNMFIKPPANVYNAALKYKAISYYRLDNTDINQLKDCLISGYPFVFGCTVYNSFNDADNNGGHVSMPSKNDTVEGGHCMSCIGFSESRQEFIIRNSWGTSCGDYGHYYIPYSYLTDINLSDDFWVIKSTS